MMLRAVALAALVAGAASLPSYAEKPAPASAIRPEAPLDERTLVYAKPDGLELSATIYRPTTPQPLPVLIDIHGGAWGAYDRTADAYYAAALAKTGLLVVSIDFRQAPKFRNPAASADVAAAVRWVRVNAKSLNADVRSIGLIGTSSGGHLALLEALRPDAPQHRGVAIGDATGAFAPHDEISAAVDYVVAMWPVSDPAARYRYARRAKLDALASSSLAYFGDEAQMWEASIPRIVTAGEAKALPPILVVQSGEDANIPQEMTFDLLRAWQARGGKLEYAFFPGESHAFGVRASPATSDLVRQVADFIRRRLAETSR